MIKIKIGDIFEIPLSNGEVAFAQYLCASKCGPLIQVLKTLCNETEIKKEYSYTNQLFPPIIVGLFAAVRMKLWKKIGNFSITEFSHPLFVSTNWDEKGNAIYWYLWDGQDFYKIGEILPNKYKGCEFLIVYTPQMVTDRIESGKIPFPYGELIRDNMFTPK